MRLSLLARSASLALVQGLVSAAPHPLRAQNDSSAASITARGRIVDARTAFPLASVAVVFTAGKDTLARGQSDSSGSFVLSGIATGRGNVIAHFARAGYRTDSLPADIISAERPVLRVAMIPLGPQVIAGRQPANAGNVNAGGTAGFDARAARRLGGVFITQADIERRSPLQTSDLFRGMAGVTLVDSGGVLIVTSSRGVQSMFSSATVTTSAAPAPRSGGTKSGGSAPADTGRSSTIGGVQGSVQRCTLRVGLDGRMLDPTFSVDEVPVETIHGIEVYLGASTTPIEYSTPERGTPCGVIMIWTRTGNADGTSTHDAR